MKMSFIFFMTFICLSTSFAQDDKEPDIYINLGSCSRTFTPLVLGEYQQVQEGPRKMIYCEKYDSIFMCNVVSPGNTENKLFFLKKNPDHSFSQIGDSKEREFILINDRAAFYRKIEIMKHSVSNEICQGTYSTLEHKKSRKIINLSLGLKNIFKDIGSKK